MVRLTEPLIPVDLADCSTEVAEPKRGLRLRGSFGRARHFVRNPAFQRLFKNAGKLQLNRLLSAGVSAAQIALIARYLSPSDYGVYALVLNTVQVIQSVFDVRCGELIIRYFFQYKNRGEITKAAATLLTGGLFEIIASLIGAALLFILAPFFSSAFFHSQAYTNLFAIAALIPLFNIGSGLAASILSIDRAYGKIALADSASTLFGFVFMLATLPFHASLVTLFVIGLFTQAAKGALRWIYLAQSRSETKSLLRSSLRDTRCLSALRPEAKAMLRFAFFNNVGAFLKILQGSAPNFAIGLWRSPAEVGFYYLGQRIGQRMSALCSPITDVTFREIAEAKSQSGVGQRMKALKHGVLLTLATVSPALLGLTILGHWSIPLVFGKAYQPGILAIEITVATYAIALLFNPLGALLMIEGKINTINASLAGGVIAQLLAIALLVPLWSSTGAAVALAIFYSVADTIQTLVAWPLFKSKKKDYT